MRQKLAVIHIHDDDDVGLTRNKAYHLAMHLGVKKIAASRLAAQVSQHCRSLNDAHMTVEIFKADEHTGAHLRWKQASWATETKLPTWPSKVLIQQFQTELSSLSKPALMRDLKEKQEKMVLQQYHLKEKNNELVEATRLKSEFLANMSHELRTPMNSIIGFTGRVLKKASDKLSPRHIKNLKTVERNAHHLLGLINSLLDLSKIEAGKMEVFAEDFKIKDLFHEVMDLTDSLVSNKGISIQADTSDSLNLYTDKTKLKQILINLVSNAVKFTDEGGITLHAHAVGHGMNQGIEIKVIDTGLGMEPEALKYIFEAFRQVDGTNTRTHGGTGLGLSITSRFCAMLGGDVGVESEVNVGSTFTVTLPLRYQPKAVQGAIEMDVSEVATQAQVETSLVSSSTVYGKEGPVILCIDDNAEVLELLGEYLSEAGYQAVCVNNGVEGVKQARLLRPLAITLDVQMPHKDGWSVLKELKNDPLTKDIPVLMATMMDNKALGFELGAYDYLEKPIMPANLIKSVQSIPAQVKHALVVDDDEGVRELMLQTLEDQGVHATLAYDGLHALEILSSMGTELPDLIILDLMMPRMDGFEVLDKLNEHELWSHIPVVVSTAKTLSQDEKNFLSAKAKNIVQKGGDGLDKLVLAIRGGGGNIAPSKVS